MDREIIQKKLADGWMVEGFSTVILAAGAMAHSILLRKDGRMEVVNIVVNNGREVGRTSVMVS